MPTILVVDDQACVRDLISEELTDEGYAVDAVESAESARAYIRLMKPDMVLLDLYLEGPDGWDVLRDIKGRYPGLPVIIVTAYDSFRDDPRLSQADGYVIKSADLTHLKKTVFQVFQSVKEPSGKVEAKRPFPSVGLAPSW